ncbi:MAG: GxxExxY protein [Acidobacteria bacterium]|nr:GxxExxY protein [Acidobacteriota bacterium]
MERKTTNAEESGEKPEVSGGGLELELEALTERIIGCAIQVQRRLGPGLLEGTYQVCLAHELRKEGLAVETEVPIDLKYDDLVIERAYRLDLLIEGTVVVELKTTDRLTEAHLAQLFTYLRFANKRLGLLLNLWRWPLKDGGIKRVLNSHP